MRVRFVPGMGGREMRFVPGGGGREREMCVRFVLGGAVPLAELAHPVLADARAVAPSDERPQHAERLRRVPACKT